MREIKLQHSAQGEENVGDVQGRLGQTEAVGKVNGHQLRRLLAPGRFAPNRATICLVAESIAYPVAELLEPVNDVTKRVVVSI